MNKVYRDSLYNRRTFLRDNVNKLARRLSHKSLAGQVQLFKTMDGYYEEIQKINDTLKDEREDLKALREYQEELYKRLNKEAQSKC